MAADGGAVEGAGRGRRRCRPPPSLAVTLYPIRNRLLVFDRGASRIPDQLRDEDGLFRIWWSASYPGETYIGFLKGQPVRKAGFGHKMKVLSLVDRATGRIQSYTFDQMISCYVEPVCRANIAKEARLVTDQTLRYRRVGKEFASHEFVNHSKGEYVRGDVFTNTVEGSFSSFKRGMKGVYQHCGEQHLHRYLAEFDFRYSNRAKLGVTDPVRCDAAIEGIVGKRLTYKSAGEQNAYGA